MRDLLHNSHLRAFSLPAHLLPAFGVAQTRQRFNTMRAHMHPPHILLLTFSPSQHCNGGPTAGYVCAPAVAYHALRTELTTVSSTPTRRSRHESQTPRELSRLMPVGPVILNGNRNLYPPTLRCCIPQIPRPTSSHKQPPSQSPPPCPARRDCIQDCGLHRDIPA